MNNESEMENIFLNGVCAIVMIVLFYGVLIAATSLPELVVEDTNNTQAIDSSEYIQVEDASSWEETKNFKLRR